ncbi:MAG: SPFH domain-containing protein [Fusobacterium gastrosuis]|uniref:prohibitin family protein n=1 Tax=Fusobacterium TaxID=848 RepID=UPI0025C4FC9B|nr:SPFH domain-containing protein [Fusobacterium sp.]MCI7224317.1 SPFH domain-containing protein [Fusobacterium sp.]MDY5794705.1 SPFH domain-containing protein [Fusobacterium gastrosuis]
MKRINEFKIVKFIGLGFISVVLLALFFHNCYSVNTGEVVIISTWGRIDRVDTEGLNFKIPFIQSKSYMEIREKTYNFSKTDDIDTSLEVSTKDMQSILIDLTVQANITDPEKLFRAFNNKHEHRFIRPRVKGIVQATISKYTIEEFVSKRSEISRIINKDIANDLAEYGINVSNVSIINHDFSDEYEKAIELKKVAEQAVERAKAEQQKLLVEYENKVKVAELDLKEREIRAKANSIESNSLTPLLLRKMLIEKWDGVLPKVQGENNSNLINLN